MQDYLNLYSYEHRTQKHEYIKYDKKENKCQVQKGKEVSPYQFNRSKHIDNICVMSDTATKMNLELKHFLVK